MEIARLIRTDFDSLENRVSDAICRKNIGTYMESKDLHLSAFGMASKALSEMPPMKMYMGYNGKSYPNFSIETEQVQNGNNQ